jgi:glycosyltransferase involved in cell wall biosynthesis
MTGFPDQHHLQFTIEHLRRQSFQDFEFIISDYIYEHRSKEIDLKSIRPTNFPVYHVPIRHSKFKDLGYAAISACKNNGIFYASGQILVFLDDCCSFECGYLGKIYDIISTQHTFPNPLHVKHTGTNHQLDGSGKQIRDCRFVLFDQLGTDVIVNNSDLYGYMTCTLEAAIRLNGFDEMFDGSRQLEDIDLGKRLKLAGYKISIHKNLVAVEQEHSKIAPDHNDHHPWHKDIQMIEPNFKKNMKCNGPWIMIKQEMRTGEDRIKSNHRAMTANEQDKLINCYKFNPCPSPGSGPRCGVSGGGCNWSKDSKLFEHMTDPNSQIYITNPPIFDIVAMRSTCMASKEGFRVL